MVSAFSEYYKSIEVTIVALKTEKIIQNIISSVVFKEKEIPQEEMNILFEDAELLIIKEYITIEHSNELFEKFKRGVYNVKKYSIRINPFDPDKLTVVRFLGNRFIQRPDGVIFGTERRESLTHLPEVWDILTKKNGEALLRGYRDIYDLIGDFTGLIDYKGNPGYDIKCILPIGIRITHFNVINKKIQMKILKNPVLDKMQINIRVSRDEFRRIPFFRKIIPIETKQKKVKKECLISNLLPNDFIDVYLISQSLPELIIEEKSALAPIEEPLKPFAVTLNYFYPLGELKDKLLTPSAFKNAGEVFEKAVAILFSLCGLSSIHLGKEHEHINLETKYQLSSSDILAYKEGEAILLIDCSTQTPDPSKLSKLTDLKQYLENDDQIKKVKYLIPVIVTPVDCTGFETSYTEVKILDKKWILNTFEKIMTDNTDNIIRELILSGYRMS